MHVTYYNEHNVLLQTKCYHNKCWLPVLFLFSPNHCCSKLLQNHTQREAQTGCSTLFDSSSCSGPTHTKKKVYTSEQTFHREITFGVILPSLLRQHKYMLRVWKELWNIRLGLCYFLCHNKFFCHWNCLHNLFLTVWKNHFYFHNFFQRFQHLMVFISRWHHKNKETLQRKKKS